MLLSVIHDLRAQTIYILHPPSPRKEYLDHHHEESVPGTPNSACRTGNQTSRLWIFASIVDSENSIQTELQQTATVPLRWRHNGRDIVSNHQSHDCLLNRLFRRRSKKTSELRVTGLCAGNSPVPGEFSAQMASDAENVSIWWRHHAHDCNNSHHYDIQRFSSCN